jgi:hypothetical protein
MIISLSYHIGWFWSSKRGVPKLQPHLHYNSMELTTPWSFGVEVFGKKSGWSH